MINLPHSNLLIATTNHTQQEISDMPKITTLPELVSHAQDAGWIMRAHYDGEIDYEGTNAAEALEALEACDEMGLVILNCGITIGSFQIINGLEPDEVIADYSVRPEYEHLFSYEGEQ